MIGGPGPLIPETKAEPFSGLCVILSLCLYSVGGLILDKTVSDPNFAGMAVFTPVINGEVWASAFGGQGWGKERDRRRGLKGLVSVSVRVPVDKRISLRCFKTLMKGLLTEVGAE